MARQRVVIAVCMRREGATHLALRVSLLALVVALAIRTLFLAADLSDGKQILDHGFPFACNLGAPQ